MEKERNKQRHETETSNEYEAIKAKQNKRCAKKAFQRNQKVSLKGL